jgi:hypothetical protein
MYIKLLLVILIICIICNYIIKFNDSNCKYIATNVNYIRASQLPKQANTESIDLNTINIKFDRIVPCGMYNIKTLYGNGILIVSNIDDTIGYLHMNDMTVIKNIDIFDIWNLDRISSKDNPFVETYNNGCCKQK